MTSEERKEARYQRRKAKRLAKKEKKNIGQKFEEVFSYQHLYDSYRKCRLGVAWKASTQKYIARAPLNVLLTHKKLLAGKFKSDGFHEFDLYERGKHRHIKSITINERVVQKCLCDYSLVPMVERTFIYDNGASVKNKGYMFAMKRLTRHLQWHYRKYGAEGYVLLFDFSKFFDHVNHDVIRNILEKEVPDERVRNLTNYFVSTFGDEGMGLGSQISQTLALASANRLDHVVKEELRIHCYGRYMDDGYLIHHSKEYLHKCLERIQEVCKELHIVLNKKKTQIVKLSRGFTWLKARTYLLPNGKVVKKIYKRSVTVQRRKIKAFRKLVDAGIMTLDDVYNSWQSWQSYAANFNSWHTRKNILALYKQVFPEEGRLYVLQGYS